MPVPKLSSAIFPAVVLSLAGCSTVVPSFDLPTDHRGVPSTRSITQRIRCELLDLIRNDIPLDLQYEHRPDLLIYDYEVAMLIGLDVKNDGGVSPSLSFPNPGFSFGASGSLKQSRQDTLTITVEYSMRDLAARFSAGEVSADCPQVDTSLAGDLGIRRSVSAALETLDLKQVTEASPKSGEFAGTIVYSNTRSIDQLGPTFTVPNFSGPGGLLSASNVNTNTLSFGFATGKNARKPFNISQIPPPDPQRGRRAREVLQRQLITDFGVQLIAIRNLIR